MNLVLSVITLGIWGLIAWVWAIIESAVRSGEWFESYPNGDLLKKQAELERGRAMQASLEQNSSEQTPS